LFAKTCHKATFYNAKSPLWLQIPPKKYLKKKEERKIQKEKAT